MSQQVLKIEAALQGNRLLIVNGQPVETAEVEIDEKIIGRAPLDQQWFLLCLLKKNLNKLYAEYRLARVQQGEVTEASLTAQERNTVARRKHNPRLL
jgi:hypothetical protein